MRYRNLALICILGGCAATPAEEPSAPEWTWDDWASAMLQETMPAELPPIPVSGWKFNGVSWVRSGAEVSDQNGDGQVDYLRIVDPPGSFNHKVWLDLDHDGVFDGRGGADEVDAREPQYKIPLFELANQALHASGGSQE